MDQFVRIISPSPDVIVQQSPHKSQHWYTRVKRKEQSEGEGRHKMRWQHQKDCRIKRADCIWGEPLLSGVRI